MNLESPMQSYFRDKHAFILLFDMSSKIQVSRLTQWVQTIHDRMTVEHGLLLLLGNKTDKSEPTLANQLLLIDQLHKDTCTECVHRNCGRLQFRTCNLRTKSGLTKASEWLGTQLLINSEDYLIQNRQSVQLTEARTLPKGMESSFITQQSESENCCR